MGFFGSLLELFGRVLIALIFIVNGMSKIFNYEESLNYMANFNVPGLFLIPAIITEILFPIFIIVGYKTRISALILALFTIFLAFVFHSDFANSNQMISFLKNIAIAGGLLLLVAKEPGELSVDK